MKAKFLVLLALVLGVVSCQTEPEGLDVNVGGEIDAIVNVTIPEAETRAAGGNDSALGVFDNGVLAGEATMRYILQVYYNNEPSQERLVKYSDGKSVAFDVRLVPGRDYQFVVWADVVDGEDKGDKHYNTENLANIQLNRTWFAMDESRDAFTATVAVNDYSSASNITVKLQRPFAKLRVVTTDMVALNNLGIVPTKAIVTYSEKHYNAFNAFAGEAIADTKNRDIKHEKFVIAPYGDNSNTDKVLFTDYFFAENDLVKFNLEVFDQNDDQIGETVAFNTDIPVNANYLTTIKGNILTDGKNFNVTIDDSFAGENKWPSSQAGELAAAAMFGGEVTLTENVTLTEPLNVTSELTINLNGNTITGSHHKSIGAIIKNNGTLTIVGGTISSTGENGGSAIQNNGTLVVMDATLNGAPNANGSWPSYTVNNTGTMTLDNTTITSHHGAVASYDNGVLTLNNCIIDMAGIPGFTSHGIYTYNGGKVIVNGGTYENKATDQNSTGASVINGAVEVNAGTFSGRIENYSGTPVLKGGTYSVKPNKNFVAAGYQVIENNGKFNVVSADVDNVVANKDELETVLEAVAAGTTNVVIDANGANIGDLNYGLSTALVPAGRTVTIRNAYVEGRSYGNGVDGTVIFEGCTFNNSGAYSIHFDNGNGNVIFKNCKLYGWNSFGSTLNSVSFENCTLDGNGTYALIRSYVALTLTNCVINTSNANHTDAYSEGVEAIAPATLTENNVTYVADNADSLENALEAGAENVFVAAGSYTFPTAGFTANTVLTCEEGTVFEGNTKLNINGATVVGATFSNPSGTAVDQSINGTFKDCTFSGSNALRWCYAGETCVFENCVFDGEVYGVHFDGGANEVTFKNCVFSGFNAFGAAITQLNLEGCTFVGNGKSGYNGANLWGTTTMTNTTFVFDGSASTEWIGLNAAGSGKVISLDNCTVTNGSVFDYFANWEYGYQVTVDGVVYEFVADGVMKADGIYEVSSKAGLNYFSNKTVENGTVIKLAADIDFEGAEFKAIAAGYSKSLTFDGQNHTIKNVKIVTCSHNTVGSAGLFFCYPGGTLNVSNLVVENATSEGATYAGVITGYTQGYATLTNITVKDCNVSGVKKIGGLVGFIEASTTNFLAENCNVINTTVNATEKQAGTIIGYNAKPATLKNCTVENSTATAPAYCDGGVRCTDPAQAELTIE